VFDPHVTIKTAISWLSADTKVILQVLPAPISLPEPSDNVHIFCYEWHPATLTVDEIASEIIVNKRAPINDIRRSLVAVHRPCQPPPAEEKIKNEEDEMTDKPPEKTPEEAENTPEKTPEEAEKTPEKEEKTPEEPEQAPVEFLAENVCITTLTGYGRIGAPSVKTMMDSRNEAPKWEDGETVTPHDIRQLYLRNGITIAFWNGAEKQKELTKQEKIEMNKPVNKGTSSTTVATSSYYSYRRKETGIKIHVDQDSDDEEEPKKSDNAASSAATAAAAAASTDSNDNCNDNCNDNSAMKN